MTRPGTTGVADYFAILGVGDTLVLKSTQKSTPIEDEAPATPPTTDADADGGIAAAAAANTSTDVCKGYDDDPEVEQDRCFETVEEECAWTERFYREIVDVKLVTAEYGNAGDASPPAAAAAGGGGGGASSATIDVGKGSDGYEVIRRTAAALAPMMTVRMGKVTAEEKGRDADLNPMSSGGLRAVVLQSEQELEAARSRAAGTGNTGGEDGGVSKTSSKVLSGLKSKVGKKLNPILQASASQEWLHGAMSTSPRIPSSSSRVDGNTSAAASPAHWSGGSSSRRRTYHVAFRRRGPDEIDRPAVADVAVRFVRIHRSTIIRQDGMTSKSRSREETNPESKSPRTTGSTTAAALAKRGLATGAGLATQMAVSGANRLMASRSNPKATSNETGESSRVIGEPRETTPRVSRTHFFPDTVEKSPRGPTKMPPFQLSDVLELPYGYNEWSIPEPYQSLIFPLPTVDDGVVDSCAETRPMSPEALLRRTFLFSHSSSALGPGLSPSEASGAGIEALLRANSPSLSITSSRGPSPISTERVISHMPSSMDAQDADHSDERSLEPLFPQLLATDSIPLPRSEGEIIYDYVPILAIRRQRVEDEERYHEDPAVVDFSVSFLDGAGNPKMFGLGEGNDDDDEEEDEEDDVGGAKSVLRKTSWRAAVGGTFHSSTSRRRELEGANLSALNVTGMPVLLLRHNTPQGFADAPFATSVLDRFPSKNYKGLPMPEEELPMFCYPTGCRLHRAKFQDAPLAQCYGFVVKNEQGDSIHGKLYRPSRIPVSHYFVSLLRTVFALFPHPGTCTLIISSVFFTQFHAFLSWSL
jgi:hypothetical protein